MYFSKSLKINRNSFFLLSQSENVFRQTRCGVAVVFEEQRPRPDAAPAPTGDPPAAAAAVSVDDDDAASPLAAGYSDVVFAGGGGAGAQLPAFLGRERGGGADAQEEGLLRHPVIFPGTEADFPGIEKPQHRCIHRSTLVPSIPDGEERIIPAKCHI